MLSSTYTLDDVKTVIGKTYAFFEYSTEEAYETALALVADLVKLLYFNPKVSESVYDEIAKKDRVGLTRKETYFYYAEVYAIAYEFLKMKGVERGVLDTSGSESLSVEGYKYSRSGGASVSSPADISLKFFLDKMNIFFNLCGFNAVYLQRTCTIFGDGESFEDRTDAE